jgi:hypothetical protein
MQYLIKYNKRVCKVTHIGLMMYNVHCSVEALVYTAMDPAH